MSKTQTSISRDTKGNKAERVNSTAYVSPQGLENVFHKYDIKAEIYRYVHILLQILTQMNRTAKSKSNSSEDHLIVLNGIGWESENALSLPKMARGAW